MEKTTNAKDSAGYGYVDSAEGLALLIEALGGASRVSLDTEADSLHHYFEKVCLIQLSFSGRNYILDPLAGFSLTGFFEILSQKELILQGADYDLRMLQKTFKFRPKAPIFDTMLAAQVLGYEKIGLAALVEKFFGVVLSKSGQKSDWSKRPLSAKQLCYASDDTKYLEGIANRLTAELQALGRMAWHRECCERAIEISRLSAKSESKETWRIKGSSVLDPKELAFVRELWKWRDKEARKRDRPSFMILRNEDLIDLARKRAKGERELPTTLKRVSGEVLTCLESSIRIAEGLSPSEWPVPPERSRMREAAVSQEKVETLRDACKAIAEASKIEPCFLASRAALAAVARHRPRSIETIMEVSGMMRWQAELTMPAIQAVLNRGEERPL